MGFEYDIREAEEQDIPLIVDLLQIALSASSSRKTEEYWRWKHLVNPFGNSVVLLAEDEETLVGVRAFMQWRWQMGSTVYRALRAVDTATHPDYRRQGVFSHLTAQAVDRSKALGFDFMFNTPNEISRPGYLKLGWQTWHRVPVYVRINNPLDVIQSRLFGRSKSTRQTDDIRPDDIDQWFEHHELPDIAVCHVPVDANYLCWRYVDCPIIDYQCSIANDQLMIYYLNDTSYGTELRICDWYWSQSTSLNALTDHLGAISKKYRPAFTSLPALHHHSGTSLQKALGLWNASRFAPLITMRSLNQELDELPSIDEWELTTGSLELF